MIIFWNHSYWVFVCAPPPRIPLRSEGKLGMLGSYNWEAILVLDGILTKETHLSCTDSLKVVLKMLFWGRSLSFTIFFMMFIDASHLGSSWAWALWSHFQFFRSPSKSHCLEESGNQSKQQWKSQTSSSKIVYKHIQWLHVTLEKLNFLFWR